MSSTAPQANVFTHPLAQSIGKWVKDLLSDFFHRRPENTYLRGKQFHDPVQRTVALSPGETYIVDSPLLQRLRYVRQLGVGHYLFPSAGYSRFEHSIGALQSATLVFDTIFDDRLGNTSPLPLPEREALRSVVRIGALLHDIGHCVFSHVSERFYAESQEIREVLPLLSKYFRNKLSPSEALSVLIIKSPAALKLLDKARVSPQGYTVERFADAVVACIAGSKTLLAPNSFLAELVNGVIDCDKLDYLARDAHMAGVPISMDVERLYAKLRLAGDVTVTGKPVRVLAIEQSGVRALEELLATRIFMYDKFYYHHKVMAAEELVRRALRELSRAIPAFASPVTLLDYGDDQFLNLAPESLATQFGCAANDANLQSACRHLARVKWRDLPRRCYAFARRFIPEPPDLYALMESVGRPDLLNWKSSDYEEVTDFIEIESGREIYVANIESLAKELGATTNVFIGVQPPRRASGSLNVPVINRTGQIEKKPAFLFEGSKWSDAYALMKQTSFVFADEEFAKVHIAAERAFAGRGLLFPPSSWLLAKLSADELQVERDRLPASEKWDPYRLPPDLLDGEAERVRIRTMQDKFASVLNGVHPDWGPDLIENWLWQFFDPSLQRVGMDFLQHHFSYFEKRHVIDGFAQILSNHPELKAKLWIPLRPIDGEGGSADQITYDLKDVGVTPHFLSALDPQTVVKSAGVVFYDDALNSGVQASCYLGSWFGQPQLCKHKKDLDKASLPPELQAALLTVPIDFAYHAARPEGIATLTATCQMLALKIPTVHKAIDSSNPAYTLAGFLASGDPARRRFVDFLQERGQRLLAEKERGEIPWSKDKVKEYALGYGGLQLTIGYRHSISTGVPVALWAMSLDPLDVWLPVLPRDSTHLVAAIRDAQAVAPKARFIPPG